MTADTTAYTARNATLEDLAELLRDQQARKVDVVAAAGAVRSRGGVIVVKGAEHQLSEDGVTNVDGIYRPTEVFDESIAEKLGIPVGYVRRLRNERPDMYDANVNGWLAGRTVVRDGQREVIAEPDSRRFLIRAFRGDGGEGVARAFLSDRYGILDNFDVLTAALDGVRQAGADVEIDGADLTDRNMYVRIKAPAVQALAPTLLRGYRSPFSGEHGSDNPTVFAGFELRNSEVGGGAFTITPRLIVQICSNGMTITKDAMRAVHLGSRKDEGVIRWSADTQSKELAVVTARARDAVATFLDVDYMTRVLTGIEETSGKPVENAEDTIKVVSSKLRFDEPTRQGILDHFIKGGDLTAGGVLHAVTSYAQVIHDADRANDLEGKALRAMELAAA